MTSPAGALPALAGPGELIDAVVGLALRLAEALRRRSYYVDVDIMGSRPYVPSDAAPGYAAAAAGVTGWISVEGTSITVLGFYVEIDLMEAASPEQAAVLATAPAGGVGVHHGRLVAVLDGRGASRARRLVDPSSPARPSLLDHRKFLDRRTKLLADASLPLQNCSRPRLDWAGLPTPVVAGARNPPLGPVAAPARHWLLPRRANRQYSI